MRGRRVQVALAAVLALLTTFLTTTAVSALTATGAQGAVPTGTVSTWGSNAFGQLGNGSVATTPSGPAAVPGLTDVVDMHGGREHVVALTSSGQVYTWGSNQEGQLGLGGTANRSVPTAVPGLSDATAVETGHNHTLVLRADGTVWSFGLNTTGQLGDGTTTIRRTPVQVRGLSNVVGVAAGRDMSYAIRSDHTLWAWGSNANGELGNGTTTTSTTPVQVQGLSNVVAVAGGRDHGLALLGDGTVWSFGWNVYGQLGDGTTTDRTVPVQVASGVREVIAGAHHSYALRTDGTVLAWGRNYRSEIGDGTTTNRTRPVTVPDLSNVVSVGAGRDHGVAVLADGTVRAWGYNVNGQLGDGTTTTRGRPVTVPGVSNAIRTGGGGGEYSVVLVGSSQPAPQPPTASFTSSCQALSCSVDGTGSHDADGTISSYDWEFGNEGTATGATTSHTFAAAGTYQVTLTVTDDSGLTASTSRSVTVAPVPPPSTIAHHGVSVLDTNRAQATLAQPTGTVAGDRLVLFVSTNRAAAVTTPAGWSALGTTSDGTEVRSWVFTRPAAASTGSVQVVLDAASKMNLTELAYGGAGTPTAAGVAETAASTPQHTSPATTVGVAGSTVLSFWVDKVPATHGWTLPAGLVRRSLTAGTDGVLLTSTSGDVADVPAGPRAGEVASAGAPSAKAVSWSVVLPPA